MSHARYLSLYLSPEKAEPSVKRFLHNIHYTKYILKRRGTYQSYVYSLLSRFQFQRSKFDKVEAEMLKETNDGSFIGESPAAPVFPSSSQTAKQSAVLIQLKKCSSLKSLESVYGSMIKTNADQDCFLVNQYICTCSTFSHIDYAVSAFIGMENPNVFVYNAMIRGFVQSFCPTKALECYVDMLRAKVMPTSYTFLSLVKACASLSALEFGEATQCHIWRTGFSSHVFVQTALLDFYSSLGKLGRAIRVFDEMPERDVFAWNTMVSTYVRARDMNSARKLFEKMPERNTVTWNTLIDGYVRVGNLEFAELLFTQMPEKDIISWTTMINSYSQNKKFREALAVFSEMISNGISPDKVTMATIISACAHTGALDLGKEMHLYALQNGFELDVYIGSALIDMYAKCGSIDRSVLVFFNLQEKNLFCWNSVIEGLAAHGFADEALKMFDRMVREKVKPNGVTFISVLSACTHAGRVEEGWRRFLSMTDDYSIAPEVGHYGCMVDLLSKAGLLEDALELIKSMKIEPNSIIWGALLGGCKLHKNREIAQLAANELSVLEPNNSGHYHLLINMYAEGNRWGEVAKIRAAMKDQGVEKRSPGSSWIEMEKKIHQFAASDELHPAFSEICLLLAELEGQLKLADPPDGYLSPEGSAVIHFSRSSTSAAMGRINCKVYYWKEDEICLYQSLLFEVPFQEESPDSAPAEIPLTYVVKPKTLESTSPLPAAR